MWRRALLVGVLAILLARVSLAEAKETHYWGDGGWGVLAVVANIVYMPVKVVYAGLGIITGSFAYVLTVGDADTAYKIWSPSVGGSYVMTPGMLRGDEPVLFNGPSYSND